MATSEAEDGRDGCGLWLSTRRVGREHLTVVHSSPSVLMVAVRSKTIEANVVVPKSPVEGHERPEAWCEALEEMLTALANDVSTCVCIDADGRLEVVNIEACWQLGCGSRNTQWQRLRHFLVGANLCAVNTVMALPGCRQGRDRDALILWLRPSRKC